MGVQVQWYNSERNILLYTFKSRWLWQQLFEARTIGCMMINQAGHHQMGQIFYFEDALKFPANSLLQWHKLSITTCREVTLSVLVAPKSPNTARKFLNVYQQHYTQSGWQYAIADNLDVAMVFLNEQLFDPAQQPVMAV